MGRAIVSLIGAVAILMACSPPQQYSYESDTPDFATAASVDWDALQREEDERWRQDMERRWSERLALAQSLSGQVNVVSSWISCDLEQTSGPRRASGDSNADMLMQLSEVPLVVFITHGFEIRTNDGSHPHSQMRTEFYDFAAFAQAEPGPSAVCYVAWPSHDGFDAGSTAHFSRALTAVRLLARDPLVALTEKRRIVALGYSQGGNYAKYAAAQDIAANGGGFPRLRVVTLGAPHDGAPVAESGLGLAEGVAVIAGIASIFSNDQAGLDAASDALNATQDIRNLPGYQQVLPNNSSLDALNERFASVISSIDYFNIYSQSDEVTPSWSGRWNDRVDYPVSGLSHANLQQPYSYSGVGNVVQLAFSGQTLGGEAPDPAPDPALEAPPQVQRY